MDFTTRFARGTEGTEGSVNFLLPLRGRQEKNAMRFAQSLWGVSELRCAVLQRNRGSGDGQHVARRADVFCFRSVSTESKKNKVISVTSVPRRSEATGR
jgi:hypothetical protein